MIESPEKRVTLELWRGRLQYYAIDPKEGIGVGNVYSYPDPRSCDDIAYRSLGFGRVRQKIEDLVGRSLGKLVEREKSISLDRNLEFIGSMTIKGGVVATIEIGGETECDVKYWRSKIPPSLKRKGNYGRVE